MTESTSLRLAKIASVPAAVLLALAIGSLAFSSAAPCIGSLVPADSVSADHGPAFPTIARAVPLAESRRGSWFPLDENTYTNGEATLGSFHLRYEYSSYRSRPAEALYELDAPSSCNGGTVSFVTGMYAVPWTIELGRAEDGRTHVVRWKESGVSGRLEQKVFEVSPAGPLRRVPRYLTRWLAFIACAAAFAFACRDITKGRSYLGPNGVARWRAGRVSAHGWIEPDDGGERVDVTGLDLRPGSSALFSTGAPRPWSFRRAGGQRAVVAVQGTRDEIAATGARLARRAAWCLVLVVFTASALLFRLLVDWYG